MGIKSENSLWYKGKSEVFREFKKSTAAILSAVASRNFSLMPGFAIEAFTDVEIDGKLKLTEYNQKIMSDAIDRELKALGLENDIALKQATMAWELEKQQLFSDLQTEFADAELLRSLSGEAIDSLMIDQDIREVGVLLSKTAIEIEIEGIKRQKEEVDLLPLPYEESLAAAKLAAATRKLAVIPYILAALAAQRTALDMEETVIMPARTEKANYDKQVADLTTTDILPLMAQKATATSALTTKQTELFGPLLEKAAASMALADKMMEQLGNHRLIAAEKVALAGEKVLRLNEDLTLTGKEITLEGKKITIEINRAELELQRAEAKVAIVEALRTQLGEIKTAMESESAAERSYMTAVVANESAVKSDLLTKVKAAQYASTLQELKNKTAHESSTGTDDVRSIKQKAADAATANVAEKLIHLLS
jgi:hypothetical protein